MPVNAWEHYNSSTQSHFFRFEGFHFGNVHRSFLKFLPKEGGRCLDVGAGSGRDAAAMANRGLHVTAVEPNDALLRLARDKHVYSNLTWIQDALPSLSKVVHRNEKYDFILMSAVWMHLKSSERTPALHTLSGLLNEHGFLAITLRLGDAEPERSIYQVSVQDLLNRASGIGLGPVYIGRVIHDSLKRSGIRWVKVVLAMDYRK